jgi:hypothetical protein
MSKIVTTNLGRFAAVQNSDGSNKHWLFECPGCKEWLSLSTEQMEGRQHTAHYVVRFGDEMPRLCDYQLQKEYAKELVVTVQARALTRLESEPLFEDAPIPEAPSLAHFHSWYEPQRDLSI